MKYRIKMKPKWDNIGKIQEKLGKKIKNRDEEFINNIKMVTGELLENSVKYYSKHNISNRIDFNFSLTDKVTISINNQIITKNKDIGSLYLLIDEINLCTNVYDMFYDRLQVILDNRKTGESKLGLLRIASEGNFKLSYKKHNNEISIYAKKKVSTGVINMESLNYEDLNIEVLDLNTHIKVSWSGKSRTQNPENILDDYLAKLSKYSIGTKMVINFDKLESMNSSTIPPLLTFIKNLEENNIHAVFEYNVNKDWQRASFKPLTVITSKFNYVKIRPSSI
ncbi:MAG: hypothetical protein B6229_01875 [Spirochaetaceae bacterium 4572_7]|nr:MAG: hypothetical protein B6229_01875 [Spirochaetaceae bacterium 4572_7]